MNDLRKPLGSDVSLRGGDFSIEAPLGMGGFGITYRGCDQRLGRIVAIKEFFPYGCQRQESRLVPGAEWTATDLLAQRQRFVEEGRTLARLRHPGIPVIFDIFEENDTAYLVMEFIEGLTFAQYMEAQNVWCLAADEAVGLIKGACEALSVVHRAQLLHRDLKPANLMRRPDGQVMLIDFGASHEFLPETVHSQTVVYTAGYAPLEQYSRSGVHGPYSDVYSLAATLYYLLTGQKPLEAPIRAVGHNLSPPAQINAQIAPALSQSVMHGLELRPDQRPATVDEFLQALLAAKSVPVVDPFGDPFLTLDETKTIVSNISMPRAPQRKARRNRGARPDADQDDGIGLAPNPNWAPPEAAIPQAGASHAGAQNGALPNVALPNGASSNGMPSYAGAPDAWPLLPQEPAIGAPVDLAGLAKPSRSPSKALLGLGGKVLQAIILSGVGCLIVSVLVSGPLKGMDFIRWRFNVDDVQWSLMRDLPLAGMMWFGSQTFLKQWRLWLKTYKPNKLQRVPKKISVLKILGAAIFAGLLTCFWGVLLGSDFLGSIQKYEVRSFLTPFVNVFQTLLTMGVAALAGNRSYLTQKQRVESAEALSPDVIGLPRGVK